METFGDFKFWQFIIVLLNFIGVVLVAVFNWFSHNKLVSNDLHHLASDVKGIAEEQKGIKEKVNILTEDVAFLKGKMDTPLTNVSKIKKALKKKI